MDSQKHWSRISLYLCLFILIAGMMYHPRWKNEHVHATISFDVSGYYIYLPSIFIYKDLKKVGFKQRIHDKYQNSSHPYQTRTYTNGNEVAKYSCGMALMYLPFFLIADFLAEPLGFERDGYSLPYQAGIHFGAMLIAFLGLYYLRKSLLEYFEDRIIAIVLFLMVIGTNYLNYASIDAALTHNFIFTLFSLLIWNTIRFYKEFSWRQAIAIGVIVGLAALTRPTEILLAIIPLAWGVQNGSFRIIKKNLSDRLGILKEQYLKIGLSILIVPIILFIQLSYWKYVGGEWIINSYGDDYGFDWFRPHLKNGLISFRKGWLVYTPMMIFPIIGCIMMVYKKHPLALCISLYMMLFIYITFSWSAWWYGGSLGQRVLVQSYPLLAFPFAFFLQSISTKKWLTFLCAGLAFVFIYYNIWLHHQAHKGGMLDAENMTEKYFWKILGKWEKNKDDLKYLDVNEEYRGERKNLIRLYFNDFENDTLSKCDYPAINGQKSHCVFKGRNVETNFPVETDKLRKWVRVGATFRLTWKEWNVWDMPQFCIHFKKGEHPLKYKRVRISRMMDNGETLDIFIDTKVPKEEITDLEVFFWTERTEHMFLVDDLYLETFD